MRVLVRVAKMARTDDFQPGRGMKGADYFFLPKKRTSVLTFGFWPEQN